MTLSALASGGKSTSTLVSATLLVTKSALSSTRSTLILAFASRLAILRVRATSLSRTPTLVHARIPVHLSALMNSGRSISTLVSARALVIWSALSGMRST